MIGNKLISCACIAAQVRAAEAEATQGLKAQIGCVALVRAVQVGGTLLTAIDVDLLHSQLIAPTATAWNWDSQPRNCSRS